MYPVVLHSDLITYKYPTEGGFTASPNITNVVVNSSSNLTVGGVGVALLDDILNTPLLDVTYTSVAFPQPGSGSVSVFSWPLLSMFLFKDSQSTVISDGTFIGTATLNVTVPASNSASGTFDPITIYPVTFKIDTIQTVLNGN